MNGCRTFAAAAGVISALVGGLVMAGWALHLLPLQRILPGLATMKANTALGFVLAGLALRLSLPSVRGRLRWLGLLCSGLVLLLGLLTLSQDALGWDLRIDELLITDSWTTAPAPPGRMAQATALNFVLLGSALALLRSGRHERLSQLGALAAGLVALIALTGYLYDVAALYAIGPYRSMALHTTLAFVLLSAGVLCAAPDRALMAVVVSDTAGGAMARRLLPLAVGAPLLIGWLRLLGQRAGYYDTEFGLGLFAVTIVVVFSALIWRNARSLSRMDGERARAAQALQEAHDILEQRVRERTAELTAINDLLLDEVEQRREAEAALRRSEILYRTLVRNLPDVALLLYDHDLRYLLAEGASLAHHGYVKERVEGRTLREIVPPESADQFEPYYRSALGGDMRELELVRDGRTYLTRFVPVKDERGTIAGALVVIIDVTPRKRAEEERLQLERKMQEAQRLESLGVLAGGVAHDFNNILTAILGHAELAQLDLPEAADGRESIAAIIGGARRAATLISHMLAYSGKGQQNIQPVSLNAVIHEMIDLVQVSITRYVDIQYRLADPLPPIAADATQIHQVVLNLVTNAAEAIGDTGGSITLATTLDTLTAAQLGQCVVGADRPPGRYVCLTVGDTGCGMDAATLARIFDPFFTTKFTGRGLGLAAVLGIVRSHGGALRVTSAPGEGTTFYIWFPAAVEHALASAPLAPPELLTTTIAASIAPEQRTILVIDDEEPIRAIAARMLDRMGFSVRSAPDGPAGLALARAELPRLCAVLLDLTMPQMRGDTVARTLRDLDPGLPIILMSGYNVEELTQQAGGLFAGFLQKPFTLASLAAALTAALGGEAWPAAPDYRRNVALEC